MFGKQVIDDESSPPDLEEAAVTPALAAALRTELHERAGSEARLRGELADARAELEARSAAQSRLEAAQGELRAAITELRGLVEEGVTRRAKLETELADARDGLAATVVARDAAATEAEGLRAELERVGAELAGARGEAQRHTGGLAEAQAMLTEAHELSARLREAAAGRQPVQHHGGRA